MAARDCCFCRGRWVEGADTEASSAGAERSWQGLNRLQGRLEALEIGFRFREAAAAAALTSAAWMRVPWERHEDIRSPLPALCSQRFSAPTGLWPQLMVASSRVLCCLKRGLIRIKELLDPEFTVSAFPAASTVGACSSLCWPLLTSLTRCRQQTSSLLEHPVHPQIATVDLAQRIHRTLGLNSSESYTSAGHSL